MFADLHFHTTCSDGKHSVDWVGDQLKAAHRLHGLQLAVLTDHDGVDGFAAFAKQVEGFCQPICASELSCTYALTSQQAVELHLLVYGLDPLDETLQKDLARFRKEREMRFFRICERLNAAGFRVDGEKLVKEHKGVLGRPHVADALIAAGYVQNREEAFRKYLNDKTPYAVPKWRFPLEEAVAYAKAKGLKTSIAHPGQYHFEEPLLKKFRALGVDAIEIYHPRHDETAIEKYRQIAKRHGFSVSGGSDFHDLSTDFVEGNEARLGRTAYPMEEARHFLGDLLQ